MALFLTIAEGSRADRARPIVATGDAGVIREALRAIEQIGGRIDADDDTRHGGSGNLAVVPLSPVRRHEKVGE